jgi:7 transmembrane sweet-taste receptor of 3 GCPR
MLPFLLQQQSSAILLVFMTVVAVTATARQSGDPIFGSKNGYDVGGTDPMCWSSQFQGLAADAKNKTGKTNDIEQLNELTFGSNADETTNTAASEIKLGRLLPECYPGIAMSIRPVSALLSQMTMGEDFAFELTLQADLAHIAVLSDGRTNNETSLSLSSRSIGSLIGPKSTIHVRLQLCDALQQGFCNPIRDTRSKDASLSRDQTDLAPVTNNNSSQLLSSNPSSFQYPTGADKWNYKEGDVLFGIPDQTTVSARWCKWALRPQNPNSTDDTIYQTALNITIRLPDTIREGAYFFVAHAVMNFQVEDNLERIDVAKTLYGNVVEVRRPPTILRLTRSMELGVIMAIAVFGATALAMFAATVYHRNHPVMKIAQGSLLSALSLVATFQIAALYTILPLSDFACHVNDFAVLVPMTMLGSLLVGRMWRVYTTLSSVSTLGRLSSKNDPSDRDGRKSCCSFNDNMLAILAFFADIPVRGFRGGGRRSSLAGLRRTVTLQQTCSLVCFLTLPQLFYQVLMIFLSERSLRLDIDSVEGIGREVCSDRAARGGGVVIAIVVYLLALWLAVLSRHLPSAFNEKEHIFLVSTTTATLTLVTLSLLGITDVPSSSPDVQVNAKRSRALSSALSRAFS